MNKQTAETIVNNIIEDLQNRCGLGDIWDGTDDDIQEEIREQWVQIVLLNGR